MPIQKINSVSFNNVKKTNKSNVYGVNSIQNQSNTKKQVNLKDMLFTYPISFGSSQKIYSPKISFEESLEKYFRLKPDKDQIKSAENIYYNTDPLTLAPTGTGKTLIAEYAINKNMDEGKTTFYTSPLKALSNEKYSDFCKLYGKENVGLLTGDIKINGNAPIVVMTTEIYKNMLIGDRKDELKDRLQDVASVIYDEFHYMNDPERGEVWETSIMYTPPNVQQLLLSATAENGKDIQKWMNRLLKEKGSDRIAQIVDVPPEERDVPLKYYIYDSRKSEFNIIPLTTEKYNLQKLGKALNPDSKKSLSNKQTEILSSIGKVAGYDALPENGLKFLMQNLDMSGSPQNIEKLLVKKLQYAPLEAERAAAILAEKSARTLNESLKVFDKDKKQKSYYANSRPQKVISPQRLNNLLLTGKIFHDEARALMQYSRLTNGDTSIRDGLLKISTMLNKEEMSIKEFEKRLKNIGLNDKLTDKIAHMLTITKYPEVEPQELHLIDILEKEEKLPAIFFKFSKKQCDELRRKFINSGKSLLNDEEKEKAAEIIKKHLDKGVFLGTGEEEQALLTGTAVHHAGKMPAYKALVEELAQNKLLKVVFATSTLGAGINIPARTVVFTQLTRYNGAQSEQNGEKFVTLSPSEFQQMAGRAGRRGKDFIGNVVVMPDKDHGAPSIFSLASAPPDAIKSNFKPTYSFITHFINEDKTTKNLSEAVDKSFLKESLEAAGQKPYKIMDKMKNQFAAMAKVVTDPELECFVSKDEEFIPTIKGEAVAKARGIDGLLFAETLFNAGLEELSPQEMAAVACALTDADERDKDQTPHLSEMAIDTLMGIDKLNKKIEEVQNKYKLPYKPLILNRAQAQYVEKWANSDEPDSRTSWEKLIRETQKDNPNFTEGDFLKSINDTVDILEQIKEVSKFAANEYVYQKEDYPSAKKMRKISDIADKALSLIKRDPVVYEL